MGSCGSHFKPEFLNRPEVVMFDALSKDAWPTSSTSSSRCSRSGLAVRRITISVTEAARSWLAETGFEPGLRCARPCAG